MRLFITKCLILLITLVTTEIKASHIVGGYLNYNCLGPAAGAGMTSYRVTMNIFVDCQFGDPNAFPNSIPITVFNSNGINVLSTSLSNLISSEILNPNINNPCIIPSNTVCVREFVFDGEITLANDQPFTVVHQRCCKGDLVDNLPAPSSNFGSTFSVDIPAANTMGCNSTPIYDTIPPLYFCRNFDVNIDLSATDPDPNDSLVYSLCAPLSFNDRDIPEPPVASPPPYIPLIFSPPFSAQNPIPANPQLSIDSRTGRLSGVPTTNGRYVFGVCIQEFRNGVLINTHRREIEATVQECDVIVTSAVQMQEQFCDGLTVQFRNETTPNTINNYFWDFGVPGIDSDTSIEFEPQFTYPQPGVYNITLTAFPDFIACRSDTTITFDVRPLLNPTIDTAGFLCSDINSVDFSVGGSFSRGLATFEWDFGTAASVATSTAEIVNDVVFTGPEPYPIQLIVSENGCSDTVSLSLSSTDNFTVDFTSSDSLGCFPLPVTFTPTVTTQESVEFLWDFGDGGTSTEMSPTHTYTANGTYDVSLTVRTTSGCISTVTTVQQNAVEINPTTRNTIDFDFFPKTGCAPLTVQFSDSSFSEGNIEYFWDLDNGELSNEQNPVFTYDIPGDYSIGLLLFISDRCADTLIAFSPDTLTVISSPTANINASATSRPIDDANFTFTNVGSSGLQSSRYLIDGVEVSSADVLQFGFSEAGTHEVSYIATNAEGCEDTASVSIAILDKSLLTIPNVFTPNGDGRNDRFSLINCGITDPNFRMNIFNRAGVEVFNSISPAIEWDGRSQGREASPGVYFYVIRLTTSNGENIEYNGTVTLIRD